MTSHTDDEIVETFFAAWKPFEVEGEHEMYSEGIFIADVEQAKERLRTTIAQERARIREEVIKLAEEIGNPFFGVPTLIPVDEVLKIIRNEPKV